jgi:hypothetical protein
MHVVAGDVLQLLHHKTTIREGGQPENAIKLIKVKNGDDKCMVGFVPRGFARLEQIHLRLNDLCTGLEVYDTSNAYKKYHSTTNYCVASCFFIHNNDYNNN